MSINVLIVDDSPLARRIIRRMMEMSGIQLGETVEAGNGEEALAAMSGNWVDVVLADVNMPGMNGAEMLRRMHDDPVLCGIPVIVASTDRSAVRRAALTALGARAYLVKPLTPEALSHAVHAVLAGTGGGPPWPVT